MELPAIEVRGLVKVYRVPWRRRRVEALRGLDLQVGQGEVVGLLGPNGSGKTTTIKALLGLIHPTRGEVRLFGLPPSDPRSRRPVGFLPEENVLYPFLDADEVMDLAGRLAGLDARTRGERADRILRQVGLGGERRRPVGEFSKGMGRRMGLAQALVGEPRLLILDEPTVGLDPIGHREFKGMIQDLRRAGTTVLLSSHLLAEVEDVCDRIVILHQGRKVLEGDVESTLARGDELQVRLRGASPGAEADIRSALSPLGVEVLRVERPRETLETLFLRAVVPAGGAAS
ncbi:MAG: ABC transporter ATP-binding protein [Planctomycetes bacterium]|nr:ABC transporter ATP-binding protein [Planctomycetota bacterium]